MTNIFNHISITIDQVAAVEVVLVNRGDLGGQHNLGPPGAGTALVHLNPPPNRERLISPSIIHGDIGGWDASNNSNYALASISEDALEAGMWIRDDGAATLRFERRYEATGPCESDIELSTTNNCLGQESRSPESGPAAAGPVQAVDLETSEELEEGTGQAGERYQTSTPETDHDDFIDFQILITGPRGAGKTAMMRGLCGSLPQISNGQ
eukprot:3535000-Rhodomonas_salina.1